MTSTTNPTSWTMVTPVISTIHLPSADALQHSTQFIRIAEYEEGAFVYVGNTSPDDWPGLPWFQQIMTWFRKAYGPDQSWLRFDRDGDHIETLPAFDW